VHVKSPAGCGAPSTVCIVGVHPGFAVRSHANTLYPVGSICIPLALAAGVPGAVSAIALHPLHNIATVVIADPFVSPMSAGVGSLTPFGFLNV